MSSLDRSGISFTILNVAGPRRAELLQYIDLEVDAPNWPKVVNMEEKVDNLIALNGNKEVKEVKDFAAEDDDETKSLRFTLRKICDRLSKKAGIFYDYGKYVSNRYFGKAVSKAAKAIKEELNSYDLQNNLQASIHKLAATFADRFGGETGPLLGAFLARAATKLNNELSKNTLADWTAAYKEGLNAIQEILEADKGDRTILDALIPGLEYIERLDKKNTQINLKDLAAAVTSGADYAKTQKASKGKSAYLGVKVVGMADPACEMMAFIFKTLSEVDENKDK